MKKRPDVVFVTGLLFLAWIFFFYRLGAMALIGPDEPRYAQVAREMLERRDVITPTIAGRPWLEKPALLYWVMMASMRVFGPNESAARLPSALSAVMIVLVVYMVGRRLVAPLFGFLSSAALIVNPMFFSFARAATTDMLLCSTMSAGLCLFLLAVVHAASRWRHVFLLGAYAFFGLAFLAKGLVGLLLPGVIILAYLILVGEKVRVKDLEVARGTILLLLVSALWYAPVIARHGWLFIQEFFVSHHFQRFASNKFRHPGPIYYYLPVILAGTLPWTSHFVSSLLRFRWAGIRNLHLITADASRIPCVGHGDNTDSANSTTSPIATIQAIGHSNPSLMQLRFFSLIWILVPLVFFSLSGSKLPGYLLPVMPAASFLIGDELHRIVNQPRPDRQSRVALMATPIIVVAVAVAAVVYAWQEVGGASDMHGLILMLAVGTAIAIGWPVLKRRYRLAVCSTFIGCALIALMVVRGYQPLIEKRESFRDFAAIAVKELRENERTVGYLQYHHSITFYTNARSVYDLNGNAIAARSPDNLWELINEARSALVIVKDQALLDLRSDRRFKFELLWHDRGFSLLRCSVSEP